MRLVELELQGFKSFARKGVFSFSSPITAVVGPNGSGKSNIVEAIRFVLGEQSMKSLRSSAGKDLIFNGSGKVGSLSRAYVKITLDNTDRVFSLQTSENAKLSLDFDQVVIGREVFRDGTNKYLINGVEVRLRDVMELIASVNIGSTGHHIISQGEADRFLNASSRERKKMLEDSLGLKTYQYRIAESERKLARTEENLDKVRLQRKEIAPHLKFLKRQVEKIERAQKMRKDLKDMYAKYLKQQDAFISTKRDYFYAERLRNEKQIGELKEKLKEYREVLSSQEGLPEEEEIESLKKERGRVYREKEDLVRRLGKLEGMIELGEKMQEDREEKKKTEEERKRNVNLTGEDLDELERGIEDIIETALSVGTLHEISKGLVMVKKFVVSFLSGKRGVREIVVERSQPHTSGAALLELKEERDQIVKEMGEIESRENDIESKMGELSEAVKAKKLDVREFEKNFYELSKQVNSLQAMIDRVDIRLEDLNHLKRDLTEEMEEATVLLGAEIDGVLQGVRPTAEYLVYDEQVFSRLARGQEESRRKIERLKIKIEEIGGGSGNDVMSEYEETLERDEFYVKEISDLEKSIVSLKSLIKELKEKLQSDFDRGLLQINERFSDFFSSMFGGGEASLVMFELERRGDDGEEKKEREYGVDINVALPRKKVESLRMLSGGERSLTSIALLFALSQVNPPPFLVLDETDAALDEANSKRYGDMLERLAEYSQLMVVTHNRETMSRAGVLYGVTIGGDGASDLLSVKFEEAAKYAK